MKYGKGVESPNRYGKGVADNKNYYDANTIATRNIPTLFGSQHGKRINPIVVAANKDCEIEVEYASAETGLVPRAFFGDSAYSGGATNYFQSESAVGSVSFVTLAGGVGWTHGNIHRDGEVHKLAAYRSGLEIGIKHNGAIKSSLSKATAPQIDIDIFGALAINGVVQQGHIGEILSIKVTNDGVVTNYPFRSGSAVYEIPEGETETKTYEDSFADNIDEVVLGGSGAPTKTKVDDTAVITSTLTDYGQGTVIIPATIGKTYRIKFSGELLSGANGWIIIGDTGLVNRFKTQPLSGAYDDFEILVTAVAINIKFTAQTHNSVIGDSVSMGDLFAYEESDNVCELIGFNVNDYGRYTLQKNINHDAGTVALGWVGENLSVNGRFSNWTTDNPDSWGVVAEDASNYITENNGACRIVGDGTTNSYIEQSLLTANDTFLCGMNIINNDAGTLEQEEAGFGPVKSWNTAGVKAWKFTAQQNQFRLRAQKPASPSSDNTIDNISVQKLLEVAY